MAAEQNETAVAATGAEAPQATNNEQPKSEDASSAAEKQSNEVAGGGGDDAAVKENGVSSETAAVEPVAAEPEPPKEMRAVVLTGFGGLKSVKILKRPEPTLGEGEVLIRTKACGLNFQDLMVRQGVIDSPPKCPFILGFECAGDIEQVGEGVEGFQVGDRVVALPEYRAWSELVAVPAKYVYRLPAAMSYLDAATITMNYTVAYILLFEIACLTPGKTMLVHSVGGGVGQAVVQLARTVPDTTIFGVCSKSKHEAVTGVDHLLDRTTDYTAEVRKVQPEGVDLVLDCLYGEECNRGYQLLRPMGKYILYGSSHVVTGETKSFFSAARSWWRVDKISPIKLFEENKTLAGFNLRHLLYGQGAGGERFVARAVEAVWKLWEEGRVKAVADSVWALEDVADAMQKMHERRNVGKMVLDPGMEPRPKPATPAKGKKKQSSEEKKDKEAAAVVTNGDDKKDDEKKDDKDTVEGGETATGGDGDKKEETAAATPALTNGDSSPKAAAEETTAAETKENSS